MLGWLNKIRVGLGFTVHSPFAYRFIRGCLRERLPYYAFRREVTDREGRRLFRVAAYFNPQTVCYLGEAAEARRVITLACPRAREVNSGADFTYVGAGAEMPSDFRVVYAEESAKESADTVADAMTFTNGRVLIAVRRSGLPAQSFRLNF